MGKAIDEVDQIVIMMMENRSFDHMLGYLSMAPWNQGRQPVDGIPPDYKNFTWENEERRPFRFETEDFGHDIPHDRLGTWAQMNPRSDGSFGMDGFVRAAYKAKHPVPARPPTLGYLTPTHVPMLHHLATEFRVCTRWFTPIPTNTHPNRLMSVGGWTDYDDTRGQRARMPHTSLDYLIKCGVDVGVYARSLSFFVLVSHWTAEAAKGPLKAGDIFKPWKTFAEEWRAPVTNTTKPKVWYVEPSYSGVPGLYPPDDDHPPLPVGRGQSLIRQVYETLRSNPERWKRTLMILCWDEHGGFFDHRPPLKVTTRAPTPAMVQGALFREFACTGPRVPAILISPWVKRASVASRVFDHTSILRTLAEKFKSGGDTYFKDPDGRESVFSRPLASFWDELELPEPRNDAPPLPGIVTPLVAVPPILPGTSALASAMASAVAEVA